jgi:hypothetical protein
LGVGGGFLLVFLLFFFCFVVGLLAAGAAPPLQKCADAELLDTTAMTVDEAVAWVIERVRQRLPQAAARSLK